MRSRAVWMILLPCLLVGGVFFAAFGHHSYHPTDHGFVLGLGWRIHGGQVPYRDFLYIRPPATIYLHSIWFALPEGWALPASRLAFYLQMALAAAVPALASLRAGLVRSPAALGALSAGFLAMALHGFPVMVSYTVDGIFFASLALSAWIVSLTDSDLRGALRWRALASFGFAISALCKQSFIFPALFFALCSAVEWMRAGHAAGNAARRRDLLLASTLPAFCLAALVTALLGSAGLLPTFLEQANTGSGLAKAGFWNYVLFWPWWAVLPGLAWPWLCRQLESEPMHEWLRVAMVALSPVGIATIVLISDTPTDLGRLLLWFLFGSLASRAGLLAIERDPDARREQSLRLLLSTSIFVIGWSASLSWGYAKPNLGLAAMAVAIMDLLPRVERRWLSPLAAFVSAAVFIVPSYQQNVVKPYRDTRQSQQVRALHEILPRFGRLWSNTGIAALYRELDDLVERHAIGPGRDFTVLHDFPLIHYLKDRQSPTQLDWYYYAETQGRGAELLTQLLELDAVFFLFKKQTVSHFGYNRGFAVPCVAETFDYSAWLSRPILNAGTLLEEGRFFCVVSLPGSGGADTQRAHERPTATTPR